MVRGVSRDILWIHKYTADKFYENWIAALCSREECHLLQEPRFKSVITKPAIVAATVATYLSADARVGVIDKTGR